MWSSSVSGQDVQADAGSLQDDRYVSKAAIGYERIEEVFNTVNRLRDLPGARRAPRFNGQIDFEKVCFSYETGAAYPYRYQPCDRARAGGRVRRTHRGG